MDISFWLKFLHRFFVTTGFIALFTIMCSADTRLNADAGIRDPLELDKVITQNTISNKQSKIFEGGMK
ncbi:MAG: hypothetical protein JNM24_12185 [Bdellovibrionaceae bacterium]|jgi:hypothetical protein|nr:hypothetical protein [Pseudobdellovibrionaceae bacterium]